MRALKDADTAAAWALCLGTCGAVCNAAASAQICDACFAHDCWQSASRLQRPALRRGFGSRSAGQCWTLDPSKRCSCGRRRSPFTQRIKLRCMQQDVALETMLQFDAPDSLQDRRSPKSSQQRIVFYYRHGCGRIRRAAIRTLDDRACHLQRALTVPMENR